MKIVSFYCNVDGSTFYSDCAEKLMQELTALRIDYVIENRSFGGSWIDNVRAKPTFLKEMLLRLEESFIWLDVDCRITKPIDFPLSDTWGVLYREDGTPHDFVHYVPYSQQSLDFLDEWIKQIDKDQKGSHSAFNHLMKDKPVLLMPPGYFQLGLSEVESKKTYTNVR